MYIFVEKEVIVEINIEDDCFGLDVGATSHKMI